MTHEPRIVIHEYDSLSADALPLGPGIEYVRSDVAEKAQAVLAERVSTLEGVVAAASKAYNAAPGAPSAHAWRECGEALAGLGADPATQETTDA